jgi:gluconolactonase
MMESGELSDRGVFASRISATSHGDDGFVDGLKLDELGNVYVTGPGGIWVFSTEGSLLGTIDVPEKAANLNWGGSNWRSLYITATTSVYRIRLRVAGNRLEYMR